MCKVAVWTRDIVRCDTTAVYSDAEHVTRPLLYGDSGREPLGAVSRAVAAPVHSLSAAVDGPVV